MEGYKNFGIGSIVWAYYLDKADEEQIQRDIDYFKSFMPLNKAYLENHRGLVTVSQDKMRMAKRVFEKNGIKASGCITSTGLVNERRPSMFDTYCYSHEEDRAEYLRIVEELAEVVDEIILDDYFFCSCRCEKCIEAKGNRTWAQYRLDLMEDFSRAITRKAKEVNPNMNFIIKYPNWYESWHENGYNPEKQRDIFDMVYSGTETRDAVYSQQHLQRYLSFSMVRHMENIAPGRCGGGWIDPWGSEENMTRWIEQANLTLLAKARELMLFNFEEMTTNDVFPSLGNELIRIDNICGKLGTPVGIHTYMPFNGDGEDQLYTYLGMGGAAFDPTPDFDTNTAAVFCAQNASKDPDIMSKLEAYVRNGGQAVVTVGFMREQYDKGIKDMTSLRLTGKRITGSEFYINFHNHTNTIIADGHEDITYEVLQYKTNASWADVSVISGAYNVPVLSEDNYGKGRLFILNIPDNYADLYKLPAEVWAAINKVLSGDRELYIASDKQVSLFAYDNGVYGIQTYTTRRADVRIYIKDECKGVVDVETGAEMLNVIPQPEPSRWFDGCTIMPEAKEYAVDLKMTGGRIKFVKVIR